MSERNIRSRRKAPDTVRTSRIKPLENSTFSGTESERKDFVGIHQIRPSKFDLGILSIFFTENLRYSRVTEF